ncbi:MAG: hypothetical protein OEW39_06870 [Deltaproteobacteria bacterium]|nr:hypothetical protein [Deltaproteobacteria bacterium]
MPRDAQRRFDRLFNDARRHTAAGVLLSDPDPFRPVLLAMLIELLGRLEERDEDGNGDHGHTPASGRDPV